MTKWCLKTAQRLNHVSEPPYLFFSLSHSVSAAVLNLTFSNIWLESFWPLNSGCSGRRTAAVYAPIYLFSAELRVFVLGVSSCSQTSGWHPGAQGLGEGVHPGPQPPHPGPASPPICCHRWYWRHLQFSPNIKPHTWCPQGFKKY